MLCTFNHRSCVRISLVTFIPGLVHEKKNQYIYKTMEFQYWKGHQRTICHLFHNTGVLYDMCLAGGHLIYVWSLPVWEKWTQQGFLFLFFPLCLVLWGRFPARSQFFVCLLFLTLCFVVIQSNCSFFISSCSHPYILGFTFAESASRDQKI